MAHEVRSARYELWAEIVYENERTIRKHELQHDIVIN